MEKRGIILNNINILNGENERQYIWRIGKMVDNGTIPSWYIAAEYINKNWRTDETEYRTECAYRKAYKSAKDFYLDVFQNKEDKIAQDAIENLKKERYKLQATKLEYERSLRTVSRFELFYENLKDAIKELPQPNMQPILKSSSKMEWVLSIADIHYGATFKSEKNKYSPEICKQRFEFLLGALCDIIYEKKIEKIKVVNLGDTIQGIIHISDLQINSISVQSAIVGISRIIANFINNLSEYCEVEYYQAPVANHSQIRPLGTKAGELAGEDIEQIIINYIYDLTKNNPRISNFPIPNSNILDFKIFDYNIGITHGHNIKSKESFIKEISFFKNKAYDYIFAGHYHSEMFQTIGSKNNYNTKIMFCPSFIGSCPFSDSLYRGAQPSAMLFGFDEKYGCTDTKEVILNG